MAKFKYKKRQIFHAHRQLAEFRFGEVAGFVEHSRDAMKEAWQSFSKEFDQTTAGWTTDEIGDYVDQRYDDIAQLRDASPQLLRHAQCMVVYGTFENAIVELCRVVHRDGKIANPPKDKVYMDDVKGYLRPHIGKRPAPFAADWQWMYELRIVRNWMAHNGGQVQEDSQLGGNWANAQRFVRRNRGLIKFAKHGDILVEDALVDRALEKAADAFERLATATERLYR
jgi:hypothetical protein